MAPLGNTLVLREQQANTEVLMSDIMGSEIVTVFIGPEKQLFNIHKNFMIAASDVLRDMVCNVAYGTRLSLSNEDPLAFKLFVEYLYTGHIPGFSAGMTTADQAMRIRHLCQFYTFSERYHLKFEIRNKVMDKIQDGFHIMGKDPEPSFVQTIYKNTQPGSILRKLALAGLYRWYRTQSADHIKAAAFKNLLRNSDDVFDDFFECLRLMPADMDPMIRQCRGHQGCLECKIPGHDKIRDIRGVFPCHFHIHRGPQVQYKNKYELGPGPAGENVVTYVHVDEACHLWSEFPDQEWMERQGVAAPEQQSKYLEA